MNRNYFDPDCDGVDGVVKEYKHTLNHIVSNAHGIKLSEIIKSITKKKECKDKNTEKA